MAEISELPDEVPAESAELEALMRNVQQTFSSIVESNPYLPEELQLAIANIDDPSALSHLIAGSLRLKGEEKQGLLEEVDVALRLRRLVDILARELEVISIGSEIQNQVQSEIDKGQREFVLRQQLDAIRRELGEFDESAAEANELREQLDAIALPEDVRRQVDRELKRLESLPPQAAEHGVIRTYLEWIASLPWDKTTEDNLDLAHARAVLDEDHYDIEQVKDRIIEFLAVRKLKPDARGSILCFVGPPGVGKTSLGRSIARALGRKFERISAGGVRDEAEIRGHRRTYIGAMPGTIIRALRDAESKNPLFMIDEIDKMGADYRGDPASAMLEVLDPEQNSTFRDHYLDVPFDLSNVMFVTTGNTLDTIPGPLLDRMEIIQLAGYTEEEKLEIAKRYLVPRQIERNGLKKSWISFSDAALRTVIRHYTREAGVRNLEREIGTVCRKIARQAAESSNGKPPRTTISDPRVRELLGRPPFISETKRRTRGPGVATGLAWTPVGGDVLFIEATAYAGEGKLIITGQLGDVMRESAQAALSYVRSHLPELAPGVDLEWFAEHDIHIHVPAGATPKDGPSAGITMATALVSLISGRPVRDDVAMTGEITLTGQVLPIGGLKEKALAAQRNEIAHHHRAGAQRARHRGHPRAPAQRPRVRLRRGDRRGALGGARAAGLGQRPQALACSRREPGIGSPSGQQATSGDRGMAAKKQAAKARSAADGGQPLCSARHRGRRAARERPGRARERQEGLRPADQRQAGDEGPRRQEAAQGSQAGGRVAARRRPGAARGSQEEEAPRRLRQAAARRHHRRRRGDRR